MSAWLDLQMVKSQQGLETILREFVSRITGFLRDWYQALREYRQLQLVRAPSASQAIDIIFREFLGDADQFYKQTIQEFFEKRCCSILKNNIEFHYKRISTRYHILGGINDESLKHVYMNSLPVELQDELQRKIDTSGRAFKDISLGEIHMFSLSSLDKLYVTQRVFSKMLKEGKKYDKQYRQQSLQIKCKVPESCTCKPKKK
ncbi:hypothetical protein Ddye_022528 [Dipteronia dyeriana]|uniref:Uncharacterized protein n=1 Tax=Dipteronia dyeriana TaxID=168575 RepID=A0AAD9TS58_9ROSI|nr:hypothetical protein Ddye_022528 [Dipteronia dyeriana]